MSRLQCPKRTKKKPLCGGPLQLRESHQIHAEKLREIESGILICQACQAGFPILAGVAILVNHVRDYLLAHAKGIGHLVPDSAIPLEYRRDFVAAKREALQDQLHIEEDLEAERVNALYVMNHYLRVSDSQLDGAKNALWWQSSTDSGNPIIHSLIQQYWDQGTFATIKSWTRDTPPGDVIELGCGVGGLSSVLKNQVRSYLGTDSSFASIALSRHINLGVPYRGKIKIPGDLLNGPVSRPIELPVAQSFDGSVDFVVSEFSHCPIQRNRFDIAISLNAIDMIDRPKDLPELKYELLKPGGLAIQSGPYIWHEKVAKQLRAKLPKTVTDSAGVVEWLYQDTGFSITKKIDHLPWLFFKHFRQLEIYSVHLFMGQKPTKAGIK